MLEESPFKTKVNDIIWLQPHLDKCGNEYGKKVFIGKVTALTVKRAYNYLNQRRGAKTKKYVPITEHHGPLKSSFASLELIISQFIEYIVLHNTLW